MAWKSEVLILDLAYQTNKTLPHESIYVEAACRIRGTFDQD
ncbi:hypothetical protein C8C84_1386 [Flavobacterium sp. 102]|nr:hypothetical protein C8C84_1386 [Flavobacterium sp. 102]